MTYSERQEKIKQETEKEEKDDKSQFKCNDAIVIIDGEFNGWVGYAQGNEDKELGIVPVWIFAGNGEICDRDDIIIEYVKNVEPEYRPNWNG